ncbi:hypothetical protein BRCH_02785c [Candidatus Burkholderia brachyanthoides]|nr:hypothetical protein BRCH_02785c [Candidatus Burkholderia brachyanthoides]
MKYAPLLALSIAITACAAQPPPGVQQIGSSTKAPRVVAQCIAHAWADKSQQQVVSQDVMANDQAVDVFVPGQQPPTGAVAVIRPAVSGPGSWVGFRASGAAGSQATGDIQACL